MAEATALIVDKGMEQQELLHCWWECKTVQLLWKAVGSYRIKHSFTPMLLGTYWIDLNVYLHT